MAELNEKYFWIELDKEGTIEGLYSDIQYSYDGETWINCSSSFTVQGNIPIYFLNSQKYWDNNQTIQVSAGFRIGGDLTSMGEMKSYAFENMFADNHRLTDASELLLSWDTLETYCFHNMFKDCIGLLYPPELPATTLADYCYYCMFWGCTSLVNAPDLPATTLAHSCYRSMFYHCESLTIAPELPAATLADYCYRGMFQGCASLNYIEMLATDISGVYALFQWVQGVASSGTFVKAIENTSIPIDSVDGIPVGWTLYNVGDPIGPDNPNPEPDPDEPEPDKPNPDEPEPDDPIDFGDDYFWIELEENGYIDNLNHNFKYSRNKENWYDCTLRISVNAGERIYIKCVDYTWSYNQNINIQFTARGKVGGNLASMGNMEESRFNGFFYENTNLIDASELILPWRTLANGCYLGMFARCTSLVNAPELPATTLASNCYHSMFKDCTSLVNAPALPATTLTSGCYRHMFEECKTLVNAPALPATTLSEECYAYMFNGCVSLRIAPVLPAKELVRRCYDSMFYDCLNLDYIKILAESDMSQGDDINSFTYNWVNGVPYSGKFIKSSNNETFLIYSVHGIPMRWTIYNVEDEPEIPEPEEPETEHTNYIGYFKSIDGNLYSVSFITDNTSDDYGEITLAGDSPVVVEYSTSDRLYDPIRTSNCTIKVVSSLYLMNLYSGKAHSTQVILKNEDTGTIEWCGFMQPNLYNQGFSSPIEEIEFEASDCISTLQYFKYEPYSDKRSVVTFKNIIDTIMTKCELINSYNVTQRRYNDGKENKIARLSNFIISEYNFYSEEDEPWTLEEILEEICKYMGYVVFQWGDGVYFMDYDMYTNKVLYGYNYKKASNWGAESSISINNGLKEITEGSYRETGADMSLDDVFNKVSVKCSYYNFNDILPDLFEDDLLENRFEDDEIIQIPRYDTRTGKIKNRTYYRIYDHKQAKNLYYKRLTGTTTHEELTTPTASDFENPQFFKNFVGCNIIDFVHIEYDSNGNSKIDGAKDFERYLMVSQLNRPWCQGFIYGSGQSWEDYNFPIMEFTDIPCLKINNIEDEGYNRVPATRASASAPGSSYNPIRPGGTVRTPIVPNYLVINGSVLYTLFINEEFFTSDMSVDASDYCEQINTLYDSGLCFYLNLPEKGWWNGSSWVSDKTYFVVPIDKIENDDDAFYKNKNVINNVESELFLGTVGYRIPLPKEMTTTEGMYLAMGMPKRTAHAMDSQGDDDTALVGNAYAFIKDLSVRIVNRNSIFFKDEDAVYENIIDNDYVVDGDEIELKITSDSKSTFSLSTVSTMTSSGTPTTDIQFLMPDGETLLMPELAIINRYVNQYSTPSIKTNVTLDLSFKPYQLITDTYWNKDFVIVGQEIDYKYGKQTLTLLEKK